MSDAVITGKIRAGYGQGRGIAYKPWLWAGSVKPSIGESTRVWGTTVGRIHHFHSKLERAYFYWLEAQPTVVDIREHYPLQWLNETQDIADRLGIAHPHNRRHDPVVMTTDFMVTIRRTDGTTEDIARTVKPTSQLRKRRVREKFAIEHTYYAERGISWEIVTEQTIPPTLGHNMSLIFPCRKLPGGFHLAADQVHAIASVMVPLLQHGYTLGETARETDRQEKLTPGTAFWVARHCLAVGQWTTDFMQPIKPWLPIRITVTEWRTAHERGHYTQFSH